MNENNYNDTSNPQQFNPIDVQYDPNASNNSKHKDPIYKKWWFWVIIVAVAALSFSMGRASFSPSTSEQSSISGTVEQTSEESRTMPETTETPTTKATTTKESTTVLPSMSKEELKSEAKEISYKELARNPDKHEGELVHFKGEVIQVIEASYGESGYRVAVTKNDYGYSYDDIIYLEYEVKKGQPRILEDDIIDFYGTFTGLMSYESTGAGKITIPSISGEYAEIKE